MTGGVAVGSPMTRVKVVVLFKAPAPAATVMGKLPAGVVDLVLMVKTVEQLGRQRPEENEAVARAGNPETEKETAWELPEISVALTELVTADPGLTDLLPLLASE